MNNALYNQIRIFQSIAREGNISAAARKLEITPPSVSNALRLLEEHIGHPLFVRTTRRIELTETGQQLLEQTAAAVETLEKELLPLAEVVTPNIPEAEILSGMAIKTKEDMLAAAEKISKTYGCAVLLKGGHSINDANDYFYANGEGHWFEGKRIENPNTHGTGCTLSSAIASNLAKGYELPEAVKRAKDYISGALGAMLDLGKGSGPMKHAFDLTGEFAKEVR